MNAEKSKYVELINLLNLLVIKYTLILVLRVHPMHCFQHKALKFQQYRNVMGKDKHTILKRES